MSNPRKPAQAYEDVAAPPIELQPVQSKKVMALGYDMKTQTMAVTFVHGVGAVYHYPNVRPEQFQALKSAPSIGKALDELIKDLKFKKYHAEPATV